ncbi:MAG: stage III sporulation protein AD [Clostridia bacterium]|nr:stage III sporulation protein AD [Clostridia bacterium]
MDVFKIIGVGFVATIIAVILKEYRKEYVIYVSIIAGIIIISMSMNFLSEIISTLTNLSEKLGTNSNFIVLLLKITGISILLEFAISICQDSGENAIATKIDLGGKILILGMSVPVISKLVEILFNMINV